MRTAAVMMAVLAIGCAQPWPTTSSDFSEVEMALVDGTARAAAEQGVRVRGEITEKMYPGLADMNPTGWYEAGVAYYYRPNVARYVSLVSEPGKETARNVAVHEVCHATHHAHDCAHWRCMARWAMPTYLEPGRCE